MEVDGVQLAPSLRGKQVPLLLAYMVLNRDRHLGREELIGALWPSGAPRSQDAALRTLLSRLRSGLGATALAGRDELILELPEPVWIDFEAAGEEAGRAQAALQRGDPRSAWVLAQVPLNIAGRGLLPGAQAGWLDSRRRELEDIRLQSLEVIGRAGLRLGGTQLASVERAARTLIEAEPYRESGYVLLMEVLGAEGNVAEGLRVFDRLRTLLREELGTVPSPEAIEVHGRLLRPAGGARTSAGADDPALAARVQLPPELLARGRAPLVGRERELAQLGRLWARALEGHDPDHDPDASGRFVLLTGDAGVGKTRLAAQLAQTAHEQDGVVLAGRSPRETLVPYQPFVEALRHYLLNVSPAQVRARAREYGSELARLVPELRRRLPELPPVAGSQSETERYRLFEAVVGLLSEISAAAPVLLVLEDLQWADRPTLLLLRHLARAPDPSRLLILGACRATEAGIEAFAELISELRRERLVVALEIAGLAESETARLVAVRTGAVPAPAFVRALHARTEGNPFFIEETVRHLEEAGVQHDRAGAAAIREAGLPGGVKDLISRRLARLDAQAIEWLRLAAVIGRDFELSLLERVVSLDEDEFLAVLDEVLSAGLVLESPAPRATTRYSFSHGLISETLYESMSAPRRARSHRRVGEALEAAGGERNLAALAYHFTRAGAAQDAEQAIRYGVRAGEQATAMLAHEEAAEHYERALGVLERFEPGAGARRCELLLALGEAGVRAGERPEAWPVFSQAARLARERADGASLARAAIGASKRYIQQSGIVEPDLIAMLEEALQLNGEPTIVRVLLLARLCGALYYSADRGHMARLSAEATELADELATPEARAIAAGARRRACWAPAQLRARLQSATELLTLALQADDPELVLQGHGWLVVDLLESGDRDGVNAQVDAFVAGARALRQPLYIWHGLILQAMLALLDGRLERAETLAEQAFAVGGHAESVTAAQYLGAQLLAIRQEQGKVGELPQTAREFTQRYPTVTPWRAGLALLLAQAGDREQARAELELIAHAQFRDIPYDNNWLLSITLLSELCVELRDCERAARLYELLLPYGAHNIVVGIGSLCQGSAARYLGLLAALTGARREAVEHLEQALAANHALRAPLHLARTQLDLATVDRRGGRAEALIASAARAAAQHRWPSVARRAAQIAGH
ncbi:MAG: AAA family ATPase [Solirubrobacteraceae bacterium]